MVEARFDLWLWREALRPFGEVRVEISRRLRLRSDLYRPRLAAFVSGLWGGNVFDLVSRLQQAFRGLGLFLAVNVARTLGGTIDARNEAGGGATVTIALPQDVQAEAYDFPVEFFKPRTWRIRRPARPQQ